MNSNVLLSTSLVEYAIITQLVGLLRWS